MTKPRISYTNMIIGTLRIGERLPGGPHARYKFTCTSCGLKGEKDSRYISRGCTACKAVGTDKRFTVVTPQHAISITPLQLLMAMRKHPDTPTTPEPMRTRYYMDGRRCRVVEAEQDIYVSHAAIDGAVVTTALDKLDQELEDGYDWLLPVGQTAQPAYVDPLINYGVQMPPALGELVETTRHREAEEEDDEPVFQPDPNYEPPEGALLLSFEKDKRYLDENYEGRELPPKYLCDWMDSFVQSATFRVMKANGQWYGLSSTTRRVQPDRPDMNLDFTPPAYTRSVKASIDKNLNMSYAAQMMLQAEEDKAAEDARLVDEARSVEKPTGTVLSFSRETDNE